MTNGRFDVDLTGWVDSVQYPSSSVWQAGALKVTKATAGYAAYVSPSVQTVAGHTYRLTLDTLLGSDTGYWVLSSSSQVSDTTDRITHISNSTDGVKQHRFVYASTSSPSYLHLNRGSSTQTVLFDNVSVRRILEKA